MKNCDKICHDRTCVSLGSTYSKYHLFNIMQDLLYLFDHCSISTSPDVCKFDANSLVLYSNTYQRVCSRYVCSILIWYLPATRGNVAFTIHIAFHAVWCLHDPVLRNLMQNIFPIPLSIWMSVFKICALRCDMISSRYRW